MFLTHVQNFSENEAAHCVILACAICMYYAVAPRAKVIARHAMSKHPSDKKVWLTSM